MRACQRHSLRWWPPERSAEEAPTALLPRSVAQPRLTSCTGRSGNALPSAATSGKYPRLDRANVFDIGLLAGRLAGVTGWLRARPQAAQAAVGYFGASTGAAAALWAAAEPDAGIAAVVSRGGPLTLPGPGLRP
jgi:dienelactone hydrolase